MTNIAILTCRNAADVCTGAACMRAFNSKAASFAGYEDQIRLVAFMQCNGCGSDPDGEDMVRKIDALERAGAQSVHVGICTQAAAGVECETITRIAGSLEARAVSVVRGTH